MSELLSNKAAVITGAANGLGRQMSITFAKEGADVVVADIKEGPKDGGVPTHEYINENTSQNACYVKCDVKKPQDLKNAVEHAEQYGGIDVMVNNAGVVDIEDYTTATEEEYENTMDVNAKGTYFGGQAAAKRMLQSESGSIINISSISGMRGSYNSVLYSASKGAVRLMTYAMACQLGPEGIRVNTLHPGTIDTGLQAETYGDQVDKKKKFTESAVPLGRYGQPEELADAALFLASDRSSYINGESLIVDGGITNCRIDPRKMF